MVLRFRCARPPHTTELARQIRQQHAWHLVSGSRRAACANQERCRNSEGAPRKCAAVLTGARRLAPTPKSLARNNKTGCGRSGNGISAAENRTLRLNQHHLAEPTMNRDDVLVWLSLTWFVALCGTAIWMLSRPACHVFGIG